MLLPWDSALHPPRDHSESNLYPVLEQTCASCSPPGPAVLPLALQPSLGPCAGLHPRDDLPSTSWNPAQKWSGRWDLAFFQVRHLHRLRTKWGRVIALKVAAVVGGTEKCPHLHSCVCLIEELSHSTYLHPHISLKIPLLPTEAGNVKHLLRTAHLSLFRTYLYSNDSLAP